MATTMKSTRQLPMRPHGRQELRRDRITAVVVLAIIVVLMAVMIWLGSLSGGSSTPIDYWPMMP